MAADARYMEAKKAAQTAPRPDPGKPQSRTSGSVKPYNSIFCDKSFEINYVPRNHGQVIDSTGAGGRGIQLTKCSPDTTERQGCGLKTDSGVSRYNEPPTSSL